MVIELKPKQLNEWTIIFGLERAVDNILAEKTYLAQVRRRDADNGLASLEYFMVSLCVFFDDVSFTMCKI